MAGNRVAPVGTGSGQMCAPDVGQGGFRGTKEIWNAAGPAGRGCALHRGLPPTSPDSSRHGFQMCQPGEGGRECCRQRPSLLPPPMPVLPMAELLPGHHFGAAEVPVTLKHHGTGWLLEPLLASPSLGCTLSRCLRFALHFGFVTWEVALGPQHPWPGHCSCSL